MTIYALSSGPGVSGIAVIRMSGKETSSVLKLLTGKDINVIAISAKNKNKKRKFKINKKIF